MIGGAAWYLLAAAVGYWVLERATNQKKNLKTIGQVVGALIIVLSLVSFACKAYNVARFGKTTHYCPYHVHQQVQR